MIYRALRSDGSSPFGAEPEPIRTLVAANDSLARAGLLSLLAGSRGITARGTMTDRIGTDGTDADVIVMDTAGMDAEEIRAAIDNELAAVPVIILTSDAVIRDEGLRRGARGAIRRDTTESELTAAISAVAAGLVVLDPEFVATTIAMETPTERAIDEALTAREIDVIRLLAEGLPNKLIAEQLGISEHTAKFHVNAILANSASTTAPKR